MLGYANEARVMQMTFQGTEPDQLNPRMTEG